MRSHSLLLCLVAGGMLVMPPAAAGERSLPIDCLPDAVTRWQAAEPNPGARFGALYLPGIVLGPPGDSTPTTGTTSVASLGAGGAMVYAFEDIVIEDRPGPDFIVFENAFFRGAVPSGPQEHYAVFTEPAFVEVSSDGVQWTRFPYDADALAEASGNWAVDRALHQRLRGLAGVTPTFSGNWTVPDDSQVWDAEGKGGISGAGGDAFDLAELGLSEVRFVRVTDARSGNGYAGAAEGSDIDALVVLHGRPRALSAPDADGDGLSDEAERVLYGSLSTLSDSDGDGTSDGREVASCRDPSSVSVEPFLRREPRLWVRGGNCAELRWSFTGSGKHYDLLRGSLIQIRVAGGVIELGETRCLADESALWRYDCDGENPRPSEGFFYLVRDAGAEYGRSSALLPRETSGGCP